MTNRLAKQPYQFDVMQNEAVTKSHKKINPLSVYKKISRRCRKSRQIKKKLATISDIFGRINNTDY